MKSVATRLRLPFIYLALLILLPVAALAAQAHSLMQVSVQVVRGDYSLAAALIETAEIRGPAKSAINTDATCRAIGNRISVAGVWATCTWDSGGQVYLLTIQY